MFSSESAVQLTPEQEAVVIHNKGPALVFAVAGAGKTTAMVHRIERLVREGIFAPQRILATSFSRASVDELKLRLYQWPACRALRPMTLHGLGWQILKRLQNQGLWPEYYQLPQGDDFSNQIYYQALSLARKQKSTFKDLENVSREDFLNWVGTCKGSLKLANLSILERPDKAKSVLKQAVEPPGLPDYLPLYKLFEQVRSELGLFTFDDLLLDGWLALLKYPDVLAYFRDKYDCILVDEFQDVNLAQSLMLDVLAEEHNNLMVIGDDDQTIYEWRGASPRFILDFEKRYAAPCFLLSDNFRSCAGPLLLANAVIEQNIQRSSKRLELTQGLGGRIALESCMGAAAMAKQVVNQLEKALNAGSEYTELAVLVRTYSQTPFLEHELMERGIPYHIPDGKRFYDRPEIRDLLSYLSLAQWEDRISEGERLSGEPFLLWQKHWSRVSNRPTRYLSKALSQSIFQAMEQGSTLQAALMQTSDTLPDYQAVRLRDLASTVDWLKSCWVDELSAADTLAALEKRLGWCRWLSESTSSPELGRERSENVRVFLDFVKNMGSLEEMLAELRRISREQQDNPRLNRSNSITLTSIHRAKGLEWNIVLVPGCNDGVYPVGLTPDIEAERRLLYVALTRARHELYVYYSSEKPLTPFLEKANAQYLLQRLEKLRTVLSTNEWTWEHFHRLTQLIHELNLGRYFQHWHEFDPAVLQRLRGFLNWLEVQGIWSQIHIDRQVRAIWCASEEDCKITLTALEEKELGDLYLLKEKPLAHNQVQHKSFGVGTVLREVVGRNALMLVVRFSTRGNVQLRKDDPDLRLPVSLKK